MMPFDILRKYLIPDADVENDAKILGVFVDGIKSGEIPACGKSFSIRTNGKISEHQYTPLCYAIKSGNPSVVDLLIKKDADIFEPGDDNKTPLTHAIRGGHLKMVEMLLEQGAYVSATSAFFLAVECGNVAIMEALLGAGCDPNKRILIEVAEKTPFEHAVALGQIGAIKKLLECGVDPVPALNGLLKLMRLDVDFAIWLNGRPEFHAHKSVLSKALAESKQAYLKWLQQDKVLEREKQLSKTSRRKAQEDKDRMYQRVRLTQSGGYQFPPPGPGGDASSPGPSRSPPIPARPELKLSPGKKPTDEEDERAPLLESDDDESGGSGATPPSPSGTVESRPLLPPGMSPQEQAGGGYSNPAMTDFSGSGPGSLVASPGTSGSGTGPSGSGRPGPGPSGTRPEEEEIDYVTLRDEK